MIYSKKPVFFKIFWMLVLLINIGLFASCLIFVYFPALFEKLFLSTFFQTVFLTTTNNDLDYSKYALLLIGLSIISLFFLWRMKKIGFWSFSILKILNLGLFFITMDKFDAINFFKLYLPITIFFIVPFLFYYRKLR